MPQLPGMYEDLTVRAWLELVRDLYERGDVDAIAEEPELTGLPRSGRWASSRAARSAGSRLRPRSSAARSS
ncbi:MAG: hypothetical protein R3B82_02150 [Sandaracinaceae bacterium]